MSGTAMAAMVLIGCGSSDKGADQDSNGAASTVKAVVAIPASLAPFGNGYPNNGDPCRRLGESEATIKWLDDSAMLVGCPTAAAAAALGGSTVAELDGVTVVSIPTGDANAGMEGSPTTDRAASTPERQKTADELEAKCIAEVEKTVGARVTGTVSENDSEAGTRFIFNVDGAQAPWQCTGNSNGSVGGVMYTGDEGAL
ncbi:hypothetical protein FQK07_14800 [Synechococcus sp. BSF8S]|uniref:hypothetical protein n=1 Tax=Synechococcales TaxID=1890424 RepID=UPI0016233364|nr:MULTISPECIES: hypothetical protein [unclassified Synechococcus]MBC1262493.1 hypothetical protein [Synechococcus sp. BSF8S]